jgi:diguanylate cyclase (GGDEF)-like protein
MGPAVAVQPAEPALPAPRDAAEGPPTGGDGAQHLRGSIDALHAVQVLALAAAAVTVPDTALTRGAFGDVVDVAGPALVLLATAALFAIAAARDLDLAPGGSPDRSSGSPGVAGGPAEDRRRRRAGAAAGLLAATLATIAAVAAGRGLTAVGEAGVAPGAAGLATGVVTGTLVVAGVALLAPARDARRLPAGGAVSAVVGLGAVAVAVTVFAPARDGADPAPVAAMLPALVTTGALVVALLAMSVTLRSRRRQPSRHQLPWLVAGLAVVTAADALSLALDRAAALPAGAWPVQVLALAGWAVTGLAASGGVLAPAADRRLRPDPGLAALLLPGAVLGGCFALLAVALAEPRVSRAGAGLALVTLAVGLAGAARVLRRSRRLEPANPRPRTDDLTGLANRRALSEALAGDDGHHEWTGWFGWSGWVDEIALLLVDLDRFKDVNEAFGHTAGDKLITAVGARMRTVLREGQLLARLGGDEFAVVLPAAGPVQATRVAKALRASLAEPFDVEGARLHVGASIGIAACHLGSGEPTDLLRRADVAMYQAKAAGTGVEVYDPDRDRAGGERLRRIEELRDALERGELEVHVQPQVDLSDGRITGAEALARWRHPVDGVLLPDSFLPLAEQTGLMRPVASLVIDGALAACATWWHEGHKVPVSVNVGAEDLREEDLSTELSRALDRHDLPPSALRVEITEQALLTDPKAASAVLERWRADGISVAIDDFGTGYSSLSYLRELPVDEVKLDRAFTADIQRGTTSTIVRHTVAMAHALWARVVAEGIEDAATARALADLGCDVGQGLHFGDAMTTAEFVALLTRAH